MDPNYAPQQDENPMYIQAGLQRQQQEEAQARAAAPPPMGMPPFGAPGAPPNPALAHFYAMMAAQAAAGYPGGMPGMPPGAPGPFPPMPLNFPPPVDPVAMATMAGMYNPYLGPGGGMPGGAAHFQQGGDGERGNRARGRGRRRRAKGDGPEDVAEDDTPKSAALMEVRAEGKVSRLPLARAMPHLLEFAKDQHGCRYLQARLEDCSLEEKAQIFDVVMTNIPGLVNDQHGSFLLQKFFDVGTVEQRKRIIQELQGKFHEQAKEQYGCRVIQKALNSVSRESQVAIADELEPHVDDCIRNMHANHVIQKCIELMPPDCVGFIVKVVESKVKEIASHMYGCRIIQRLLEHCTPQQLIEILKLLVQCIPELATDQYGNYVIQHMLEHGRLEDKRMILKVLRGNVLKYATDKCSSNVLEKAFEIVSIGEHAKELDEDRVGLNHAVLTPQPPTGEVPLLRMMCDKFGNYIVQRMLEYCRGVQREQLINQLVAARAMLTGSAAGNGGKQILELLKKEPGLTLPPDGH